MRTELCSSCTSFKSRAQFYKEKAFKSGPGPVVWRSQNSEEF